MNRLTQSPDAAPPPGEREPPAIPEGEGAERCARGARLLWRALTGLFLAAPFALLLNAGVDVPNNDDWSRIDLLTKAFAGEFSVKDLFTPENEHLGVLPRALCLANAKLFAWDRRAEMALAILFALFGGFLMARGLGGRFGRNALPLSLLAALSLHAWDNWTWAIQTNVATANLATIAALFLLSARNSSRLGTATAFLLALIAATSFLSGYLVWPLGALLLFLRADRRPLRGALLWLFAGAACAAAQFFSRPAPPSSVEAAAAPLRDTLELALTFAARQFGSGLIGAQGPTWTFPLGATGLGLLSLFAVAEASRARRDPQRRFPLALALFSLGASALIAIGRSRSSGLIHAEASRYAVFAAPGWSLLALSLFSAAAKARLAPLKAISAGVASLLVTVCLITWPKSVRQALDRADNLRQAEAAFAAGEPPTLQTLNRFHGGNAPPWLPAFGERYATLRHHALSFTRRLAPSLREDPAARPMLELQIRPGALTGQFQAVMRGGLPHTPVVLLGLGSGQPLPLNLGAFDEKGELLMGLPKAPPGIQAVCIVGMDQVGQPLPSAPLPYP